MKTPPVFTRHRASWGWETQGDTVPPCPGTWWQTGQDVGCEPGPGMSGIGAGRALHTGKWLQTWRGRAGTGRAPAPLEADGLLCLPRAQGCFPGLERGRGACPDSPPCPHQSQGHCTRSTRVHRYGTCMKRVHACRPCFHVAHVQAYVEHGHGTCTQPKHRTHMVHVHKAHVHTEHGNAHVHIRTYAHCT